MDPVDALTRLGGVARLNDLLELTSRARIRTAEANGVIRRPGRGRYALPTAKPALDVAARVGGYASHLCAAAELGWEIARQPELPQVVIPRHRQLRTPPPHVDQRMHPVTSSDTRGLVTGPALTVLLCARDLPFDEALTVADSCLRHGDLDHDELVAAAASWPHHVRTVADLADPVRGIALEADSWGFHAGRDDHERDCVRYNALVVTGWQVLRFTYDHVMFSQAYVVTTIEHLAAELAA